MVGRQRSSFNSCDPQNTYGHLATGYEPSSCGFSTNSVCRISDHINHMNRAWYWYVGSYGLAYYLMMRTSFDIEGTQMV